MGWALPALLAVLALGCRGHPPPAASAARAWAAGPVQWLLLPEERRQAQRVRSHGDLDALIQEFWDRRRCSAPGGEHLSPLFALRVDAADRLYPEGERRGALSDRGRALILLGPPQVLRYSRRTVPLPTAVGGPLRPTRNVPHEEWVYTDRDLPPALVKSLGLPPGGEVTLGFLVERRGTVLVQGEKVLQRAARALARPPRAPGSICGLRPDRTTTGPESPTARWEGQASSRRPFTRDGSPGGPPAPS